MNRQLAILKDKIYTIKREEVHDIESRGMFTRKKRYMINMR